MFSIYHVLFLRCRIVDTVDFLLFYISFLVLSLLFNLTCQLISPVQQFLLSTGVYLRLSSFLLSLLLRSWFFRTSRCSGVCCFVLSSSYRSFYMMSIYSALAFPYPICCSLHRSWVFQFLFSCFLPHYFSFWQHLSLLYLIILTLYKIEINADYLIAHSQIIFWSFSANNDVFFAHFSTVRHSCCCSYKLRK